MATKKLKKGKVPNLRFKELKGDWEQKILNDLGDFVGGGTPTSSNPSFWNGNIPWVSSSDLNEHDIHTLRIRRFITQEAIDNSATKFCVAPVILIVSRVGVGKIAYSTESVCTSQDFTNIINVRCDGLFLSYLLGIKMRKLASNTQGTSIKGISTGDIKHIQLFIPNDKEQQKISSLLALIDKRISTQIKIIDQLETLIKGLREKLFARQSRFKADDGRDFPDWEEKRMSDLYTIKATNSFSRDNLNYENGEVKNIHYGDIHTKFKSHFKIGNEIIPFINVDISIGKISEENYCKVGDMVFADASEDLNDVGKSIEIVSLENQKVLSGLHTILARPGSDIVAIGFGGHYFKSENIRQQIQKRAQGTKITSISPTRLQDITLFLPCKKEQVRIAEFLSLIDAKIETERNLLHKYERQKTYLLHNMFI